MGANPIHKYLSEFHNRRGSQKPLSYVDAGYSTFIQLTNNKNDPSQVMLVYADDQKVSLYANVFAQGLDPERIIPITINVNGAPIDKELLYPRVRAYSDELYDHDITRWLSSNVRGIQEIQFTSDSIKPGDRVFIRAIALVHVPGAINAKP